MPTGHYEPSAEGYRTFLPDPRFQAAYALDLKIDTELYGSDGLLIFHKK